MINTPALPEAPAAPLPDATYDNRFEPDSVYGHALDLLQRHRTPAPPGCLHLDIGCGYGRIAEPLSASLGLTYVGCDLDQLGLSTLAERGYETHVVHLGATDVTLSALRSMVGDRAVASITLLDTLEHLPDGLSALRAIAMLASEKSALVVISVPNFAHADIAAKLLLGRLDITDVGLLDHTHMRTFTAATFGAELRAAGLYPADEKDTHKRLSDQHFPAGHPLLERGTELAAFVRHLRDQTDPAHADVLQLVRLCAPGPADTAKPWSTAYTQETLPFLSVVIRTQGRRLHTLREVLVCLHGQTDRDIEIIVAGHQLSADAVKAVERVIDDQPEEMRARSRLLLVEGGNRTRPLNCGFAAATGRYIAILDDDDIPFAHWVETFRDLHARTPGRLLRASCVRQSVRNVTVQGHAGLRAEDTPRRVYPDSFDLFEHLRGNHTPPVTLAFPRGVFHDLGLRFDETLTTTEDWDFMMRVALLVGTASSPVVTSIYRWWETGESSRSLHAQAEWDRNHATILNKMDAGPLLLPPGSAGRIRYLLDTYDRHARANEGPSPSQQIARLEEEVDRRQAREASYEAHVAALSQRLSTLEAAIAGSFAIRMSRLIPGKLRRVVRAALRIVWRASGGRFWYRVFHKPR